MDWLDRPQTYEGLYGILQLLQGSNLNNFPLKTLKLVWVAFHSLKFSLKCLDYQSSQYKKLAPVLSRFCNGLWRIQPCTQKSVGGVGLQVPKPIAKCSFFSSIYELLVDIYVATTFSKAFSSKFEFLLLELLFLSDFGFMKGSFS